MFVETKHKLFSKKKNNERAKAKLSLCYGRPSDVLQEPLKAKAVTLKVQMSCFLSNYILSKK